MSLTPGTKLGPYEILAPLGAGGMGEVYKAKDTRLDRTVAIKVLPAHIASHPEVRQRFEREARAVSSLNHPHICTLYDIGSENGIDFMVMEHIEGDTLADRLKKGALPLDQALQYGIEIADALDKAHRQGVVHRDLKPGNIMLTKSGAKLLDFGLAKMSVAETDAAGLSALPTEAQPLTKEGSILGTFQYMAPEQLEGKEADPRTDLFAFGAVVYEMVTGKKAFEGKSQASLIGAIMNSEPQPMSELQALTPPSLNRVVTACLEKDPEARWQAASDLRRELKWMTETAFDATEPLTASMSTPSVGLLMSAVAVSALVGIVVGYAISNLVRPTSSPPDPVRRTVVSVEPERVALSDVFPLRVARRSLAWSPDGNLLVYVAEREGQSQLYLRPMHEYKAAPLKGTEGGFAPFFSPGGEWVGFFTANNLKKIAIDGGTPVTLSPATNAMGGTWNVDDTIVFAELEGQRLSAVSADGGDPVVVLTKKPSQDEWLGYLWPQFLPDGEHVLVTANRTFGRPSVGVVSLETGDRQNLVPRGSGAQYLPTGHLLYANDSGVVAAPFDLLTLKVTASAVPVLEGVRIDRFPQLAFSSDGSLAYVPGSDMAVSTPVWVNRFTKEEDAMPVRPDRYGTFRLSRDGRYLAIEVSSATTNVWVYDFQRAAGLRKLTASGNNLFPTWAPDDRVTFLSDRVGVEGGVFLQPVDGGSAEQLLVGTSEMLRPRPDSWSPDGTVTFFANGPDTAHDIWILPGGDIGKPQAFVMTDGADWGAAFSPDGTLIAYTSDRSGQFEVYVEPYPATGQRWPVSTGYGEEPLWSAAGDELFYRRGRQFLSVPVDTGSGFEWGEERVVIEGRYLNVPGISYAVSPDAKRFLLLKEREQPTPTHINIVTNWFEELKRLVPTED